MLLGLSIYVRIFYAKIKIRPDGSWDVIYRPIALMDRQTDERTDNREVLIIYAQLNLLLSLAYNNWYFLYYFFFFWRRGWGIVGGSSIDTAKLETWYEREHKWWRKHYVSKKIKKMLQGWLTCVSWLPYQVLLGPSFFSFCCLFHFVVDGRKCAVDCVLWQNIKENV